jgi:hypothetical protein
VNEWYVGVPAAVLALAVLALAVAVVRLRRRVLALTSLVEEVARQRSRNQPGAGVETGAGAPSATNEGPADEDPADEPAYVITHVVSTRTDPGPGTATEDDRRIDGSLFADLVLRESLVKGVSFAYGVRRALAPETRNRIRFLMRQEVKRSRKQRKADLRAARRLLAEQQRAAMNEDAA